MDQPAKDNPLEERLCLVLYQASHAMTAAYRQILQPLDLTYPQYTVLSALWRTSPLTVKSLSSMLGSDYGTMSPLVKRLEARALVHRARGDADEREVRVHLTQQGRQLEEQAQGVQAAVRRASGLSDDRLDRLADDLQDLTTQLRQFLN